MERRLMLLTEWVVLLHYPILRSLDGGDWLWMM